MKSALQRKLTRGRPVELTPGEEAYFVEILRKAMATTLECPVSQVRDDARIFGELGLDSIDVFDLLDQLGEAYEVALELEPLPESLLKGNEDTTFQEFADGLLRYFREPPPAEPGASSTA